MKRNNMKRMVLKLEDFGACGMPIYSHESILAADYPRRLIMCTSINTKSGVVDTKFILRDLSYPEDRQIQLITWDIHVAIKAFNEYYSPSLIGGAI